MSENITFNETDHPDMMDVPLQGAMFKEFIIAARQMTDLVACGLSPESIAVKDPKNKHLHEGVQAFIRDVTSHMESEGMATMGLSITDFKEMITEWTKARPENVDLDVILKDLRSDSADIDTTRNLAMARMLHIFSMCLAVQENRGHDLIAMVQNEGRTVHKHLDSISHDLHGNKEYAGAMVSHAMEQKILHNIILSATEKRASPLAPLLKTLLFGDRKTPEKTGIDSVIDHVIEAYVGSNAKTVQGQQLVRAIKERTWSKIQEHIGVEPSHGIV